MKRLLLPLLLSGLFGLLLAGCDTTGDDGGTARLTGRVVDNANQPVAGAVVRVPPTAETSRDEDVTTLTDSTGTYSVEIDVETSTDLVVVATKDGATRQTTVTVIAGRERAVPLLVLTLSDEGAGAGDGPTTTATLEGRVVDRNGEAVPDARVSVPAAQVATDEAAVARTGADGAYTLAAMITESRELTVTAAKDGFETSTTVTVFGETTRAMPLLVLPFPDEATARPGRPANILLQSVDRPSIGILGSGAPEVARVTYLVTDSAGAPVTLDDGAFVRFTLGQQPGGGAFIAPERAETDSDGKVTVNLSSGTRAGTVQIIAEADVEGRTLRSNPVSVVIHGGLPDAEHFSIGPAQFNFPGLRRLGETNPISVIVGDRYSNPVKEGTAVYFETSHGVMEGSALTGPLGGGTATLTSANPRPADGIAVVTASTADENQQRIAVRTPVVFSGVPQMVVDPATARLGQTYSVTLTDGNGNPLAPGTTLRVLAEGTKVKATGNVDVTLDDTAFRDANGDGDALDYEDVIRGPGVTEFSFRAVDDLKLDETGNPVLETITLLVDGPNGRLEIVLTPSGAQASQNAATSFRADGSALFVVTE